jgi:glycosyltransferase involved in cell wall biosynthesis
MDPKITICICTYDRYDVLVKAIDSATKQSLEKDSYRVLVIDNSPDHERAAEFGRGYSGVAGLRYLVEKTPGLSNARNVGARECGTEYIAFMDDDAIASPTWLAKLLFGFENFGDRVAVVGGRVIPIWEALRPAWLSDQLLGYVSVVNWGGDARVASETEWFAGTNIAFHTKTILDAGGFDTKLGRNGGGAVLMSNEETAVMHHLRSLGRIAVYVPDASVQHLVERKRTTQTWFRKRVAWQAMSDYMSSPSEAHRSALGALPWAKEYFFQLPPDYRTVRGLYYPTDSSELFARQLNAIYTFTILQMTGFDGVEARRQQVKLEAENVAT